MNVSFEERNDKKEQIWQAKQKGYSPAAIAEGWNLSLQTVYLYLREKRAEIRNEREEAQGSELDDYISSQLSIIRKGERWIERMEDELDKEEQRYDAWLAHKREEDPNYHPYNSIPTGVLMKDAIKGVAGIMQEQGKAQERIARALGLLENDNKKIELDIKINRLEQIFNQEIHVVVPDALPPPPEFLK